MEKKWSEIRKATEQYSQTKVTSVLKELTGDLLREKPEDVYQYILEWARKKKTEV